MNGNNDHPHRSPVPPCSRRVLFGGMYRDRQGGLALQRRRVSPLTGMGPVVMLADETVWGGACV